MFNSLMMLAVEANGVVALRMMKLMRGGRRARREAKLMVSEKIDAAFEATARLMSGASGDEIVLARKQVLPQTLEERIAQFSFSRLRSGGDSYKRDACFLCEYLSR